MGMGWTSWAAWSDPLQEIYTSWTEFIGIRGNETGTEDPFDELLFLPPLNNAVEDFFLNSTVFTQLSRPERLESFQHGFRQRAANDRDQASGTLFSRLNDLKPEIPVFALGSDGDFDQFSTVPTDELDAIDPRTVVVGVIDRAIALGHQSWRFDDGSTRLLGAWQQISKRPSTPDPATARLPFGRGLLNKDINDAIDASRLPGQESALDQEAFNRRVGSEDYINLRGHREFGRAHAHGTHVLDACAGVRPDETSDDEFRALARPMVVNLPDRSIVGLSSHNLTYFVIMGIMWIAQTADRYWLKSVEEEADPDPEDGLSGFPIIINLSFAKQAGPRDGTDPLSSFLSEYNQLRHEAGFRPILLVAPTGNDNLSQGNAHAYLTPKLEHETENPKHSIRVPWRISPSDQSSNYVEVWAPIPKGWDFSEGRPPLNLTVTPPGGQPSPMADLTINTATTLGDIARIYCEATKNNSSMIRFVICVAPTEVHSAVAEAPAGVWHIDVENVTGGNIFVTFNIQTDQSEQPESQRARPSFFDDPNYFRYHPETGVLLDSYNFPFKKPGQDHPPDDWRINYDQSPPPEWGVKPEDGIVRRHGTINALVGLRTIGPLPGSTVVAGYRVSDGKPAPYSSTGLGPGEHMKYATQLAPMVSLPTDDGVTHTGRLAAGSGEGSVRAMQGTSFACAQLTRQFVEHILADQDPKDTNPRDDFFRATQAMEREPGQYRRYVDPEKGGGGRRPAKPRNSVPRTHTEEEGFELP